MKSSHASSNLLLAAVLLLFLLTGCGTTSPSYIWQHPDNPGPAQLYRDLDDCRYYAGITDPRAFGAERPIDVQEWDTGVQECMTARGWHYVKP